MEARSQGPGLGSEFVVDLPVSGVSDQEKLPNGPVGRFPPRRILVVDDNADAAETLALVLASLGATVTVAHSGPEALACIDTFKPDVLLLDIGMPGMDGYQVARRLPASGSHLLLVALTGWGQEHDQRRALEAGFDHHMIKPPDLGMLRSLLLKGWPTVGDGGFRGPSGAAGASGA